jgi:hypothetical protein
MQPRSDQGLRPSSRIRNTPPFIWTLNVVHHRRRRRPRAWLRGNRSTRRRSAPRIHDGVIAQPSAPQFSSSHAVMSECSWPNPPGETPILMRTGKRRSAVVICGCPGILQFPFRSYIRLHARSTVSSPLGPQCGEDMVGLCVDAPVSPPMSARSSSYSQ